MELLPLLTFSVMILTFALEKNVGMCYDNVNDFCRYKERCK